MGGPRGFSEIMDLELFNGSESEASPDVRDSLLVPETADPEQYATMREFHAIKADTCAETSNCKGWGLAGTYEVMTSALGETTLVVDAVAQSPGEVQLN